MKRTIIILLALAAPPSYAGPDTIAVGDFSGAPDKDGVPAGWTLKEKSGDADFEIVKEDGKSVLHMKSKDTSFSLNKEIPPIDLKDYPYLQWRWKVMELPKGGDFRKSSTDDQAAQILLAFSRSEVLVYLWDTTAPKGAMEESPSPPLIDIYAVAVESGPAELGKWVVETRNVYEDYKKLFGKEPPNLGGIRFQTNSQHTDSSAECYFGEAVFKKTP